MVQSLRPLLPLLVFACWVLTTPGGVGADDEPGAPLRPSILPPEIARFMVERRPAPNPQPDAISSGSVDWAALIDSTWGPSPWSQAQRTVIFDVYWDTVDEDMACFQDLETDWDALRLQYRTEATAPSISAGRFTAIMTHMAKALQEGHADMSDSYVSWTLPDPGVPLFYMSVWGAVNGFGAAPTPLPDGTVLLYDADPGQPLGLEPGDRILGFDGRSWDDLSRELLNIHELPIAGGSWFGSDDEGFDHTVMAAAAANWHLFSTIDVLKHSSGEVQHLSTSPMVGYIQSGFASEQLPIPSIPRPDFLSGEYVTWGILPGTNIGYIYGASWSPGSSPQFEQAIDEMTQQTATDGLIIDFRFNLGGGMNHSDAGLAILFDTDVSTIDFVERCGNPNNHLSLCPLNIPESYVIHGNPATSYTKPIAVLTGPGAISAGDQIALRFKFHPTARWFGKSTSTAFNAPAPVVWNDFLIRDSWYAAYCDFDAFLLSDPGEYLTHDEQQVDCNVWFEPDDAAQGIDTVVQTAIAWIEGTQPDSDGDTITDPCDNCIALQNAAQTDSDLDGSGDACDCAPNDSVVYPGAIERNDGVDNQCPGDAGFGVADETSAHSGFLNVTDKDEYVWIGQRGATEYQVARSTEPDFGTSCVSFTTNEMVLVDTEVPPSGTVFHYLNRPSIPVAGSWGQDSNAVERSFVCM